MELTVLICSVDPKRRNKLVTIIKQLGFYVVSEAADVHQALRQVQTTMPQLVLFDIVHYDPGSLEVASLISRERLAPVILISGPHHQEVVQTVHDNSAMAYVVTPINLWALEASIYATMANFRKLKQMEAELSKLKDTLESRKLVDKAKHILMKEKQITEPEAFRLLQKESMDKGIPMKKLAEAIVFNEK